MLIISKFSLSPHASDCFPKQKFTEIKGIPAGLVFGKLNILSKSRYNLDLILVVYSTIFRLAKPTFFRYNESLHWLLCTFI